MARPKGSKNKSTDEKIVEIIEELKELDVDQEKLLEAIDEVDDLLSEPVKEPKKGRLLGYHPITGEEVWG